jgi:poly(A) polymerase Pap1
VCIITPSIPQKNSAQHVSISTLELMKSEFRRGEAILSSESENNWETLVKPSEFFVTYPTYLLVVASSISEQEHQSLFGTNSFFFFVFLFPFIEKNLLLPHRLGWLESILMVLIYKLEPTGLGAVPFPKVLPKESENFPFCNSYVIGLKPNEKNISFVGPVQEFLTMFDMWKEKTLGMNLQLQHIKQ